MDVQASGHTNLLPGKANPLEASVLGAACLPPFKAADIELPTMRVETGPHSTGLKLDWELKDAGLIDTSNGFLHHEEESALSVGAMNHVPLEGPPLIRGIPCLPTTGIIDLVRDPAERPIVGGWRILSVMSIHESVKAALFDQIYPR